MTTMALVFISGMFSGIGILAIISLVAYRRGKKKMDEEKKQLLDALEKEAEKLKEKMQAARSRSAPSSEMSPDVLTRLQEASQISRQQGEIAAALEVPSKNAVHSKHKIELVQRWKKLEQEKYGIIKSIVDEGFDPVVTISEPDGPREVKLSDFLTDMEMAHDDLPFVDEEANELLEDLRQKTDEGDSIKKVTKNGKTFFMIERKNDDTVH